MRSLRRIRRLLLIGVHLCRGIVLAGIILGRDPGRRSRGDWNRITRWMGRLCRIIGLRVHAHGSCAETPSLLVANHISWHDIVVLQSLVATGFVAKSEIRGWPLIGWLAHCGNTLFIRRGQRDSVRQITRAMGRRMGAGQNVMMFPEGTTTDGDDVAPFRSRLFEPAIELELPVQPVAVYHRSPSMDCADLAFIGEETFMHHLLRVLGEPYIDVYVRFCDPIPTDKNTDRRVLAEQAQNAVAAALKEIKITGGTGIKKAKKVDVTRVNLSGDKD